MSKSDETDKNIIVIGGLLVDDIAISEEYLRAGSSNPVQWQHRLGGVATNVARVVAQQLNTRLIACTGDDDYGKLLANLLEKEILQSSLIVQQNQASDRYTAVLDHDGELYIGLADTRLAEQLQWSDIKTHLPATRPDAIVIDANLSEQCLTKTMAGLANHYQPNVPVIALAVSPKKSLRWLPVADSVATLLCNRREAAALTGLEVDSHINALADALIQKRFQRFIITDGSEPIVVQELDSRHTISVPPVDIEQNVNGAGDALAGATIVQLALNQSLLTAVSTFGLDAARSVLIGDASPPEV